jgi:hypothetical protein
MSGTWAFSAASRAVCIATARPFFLAMSSKLIPRSFASFAIAVVGRWTAMIAARMSVVTWAVWTPDAVIVP